MYTEREYAAMWGQEKEEKRNMGEWWYKQEYFCEFMDAETQAFTRQDIDMTFEEEVEIWQL